MQRIRIYGSSNSKASQELIRFCDAARYPHTFVDLLNDHHGQKEYRSLYEGAETLPQAFIGEERLGGLEEVMALSPNVIQQKISG